MPGTSTEQVMDKGIRQNSTKEWTHSLTAVPFCPGAPKRVPSDSEKHRRVYTSSNVCHSHEWRVDTASWKTLKKRNACLHAVRQAVETKIACIHGLRSEGVKEIKPKKITLMCWLFDNCDLHLKYFLIILTALKNVCLIDCTEAESGIFKFRVYM